MDLNKCPSYNWFYLKLGKGSSDLWRLDESSPTAAIYFGRSRLRDLLKGKGDSQAVAFCKAGEPEWQDRTRMVAIAGNKLWILKPSGVVSEPRPLPRKGDIVKVMPLTKLAEWPLGEVPAVLAGLRSNKFLGFGTFRPITNWGNIKALHWAVAEPIPSEHLESPDCFGESQLLECLGSIELETLIAKTMEAAGCFVPAYRGGTQIAADVIAVNNTAKTIAMPPIRLAPRRRISIQVKGWSDKHRDDGVDYMFRLPSRRALSEGEVDGAWLLDLLENRKQEPAFAHVVKWLHTSLGWLDKRFLQQYALFKK